MMASNPIRAGGYIDAFCTKCDLDLGHTIIAMVGPKVVKVRCDTCGAHHSFRGEQPLIKAASPAKPKKAALTWEERLKGKNVGAARGYTSKLFFRVNDVVDHKTFGLGVVTANRADKIDVSFRAFTKTLINGKAP